MNISSRRLSFILINIEITSRKDMRYKHEYITSELSDMLNMILSYPDDEILEEEYVIKAIDDCVKKSCPSINDLYNKFSEIIFAIYCLSEE